MIVGLFRTYDRLLGECVRVHWASGNDAAPILHPEVYKAMGGQPAYELLPARKEFAAHHRVPTDPLEIV